MGISLLVEGTILQSVEKKHEFIDIHVLCNNRMDIMRRIRYMGRFSWLMYLIKGEYVVYHRILVKGGKITEYDAYQHCSQLNILSTPYHVILPSNSAYEELRLMLKTLISDMDKRSKSVSKKAGKHRWI